MEKLKRVVIPKLCSTGRSYRMRRGKNGDGNVTPVEEMDYDMIVAFLQLIDTHPMIRRCLHADGCFRFSDKYLIATTLVYFNRLKLTVAEFTVQNFFLLLFLANDMEEDLDFKVTDLLITE